MIKVLSLNYDSKLTFRYLFSSRMFQVKPSHPQRVELILLAFGIVNAETSCYRVVGSI